MLLPEKINHGIGELAVDENQDDMVLFRARDRRRYLIRRLTSSVMKRTLTRVEARRFCVQVNARSLPSNKQLFNEGRAPGYSGVFAG
jgi:hypothetical protein